MNPLYQQMQGQQQAPGVGQILQQFNQFRQSFKGDPQQMVQQLLNSGRVSQQQYNQAVQMAQQLQNFLR